MKKLAISLFLIATTLLATACENKKQSYNIIYEKPSSITVKNNMKSENIVEMPISIMINDTTVTKYVQIEEDSSLEDKLKVIINSISEECFNGLPMDVKVYGKDSVKFAKIKLVEHKDLQKSRVTWKDDYLNESTKEYTINTIIKNVIQEGYKGNWIEKVQLYYNDELIQID